MSGTGQTPSRRMLNDRRIYTCAFTFKKKRTGRAQHKRTSLDTEILDGSKFLHLACFHFVQQ